jgi:signal transduction histidine kinase
LAVVRELVEAHGGSVVASSAGQHLGSEFVVTLPVATAHPGVASIRAVQ